MAKAGRKSVYDVKIYPHIDEIKKAVESGATISEIATALGVATSTLNKYKAEKEDLAAAFACAREKLIVNIRAALLKKALGYDYTEEKKTGKKDKNGENIILVEKYTRHMPPSETACAMMLRNLDSEWLDRDITSTELKKQEIELKKAIAQTNNFDLNLDEVK